MAQVNLKTNHNVQNNKVFIGSGKLKLKNVNFFTQISC
ncbi:hypothetical protein X975_19030, partial [Stegodyphus mimosarum]